MYSQRYFSIKNNPSDTVKDSSNDSTTVSSVTENTDVISSSSTSASATDSSSSSTVPTTSSTKTKTRKDPVTGRPIEPAMEECCGNDCRDCVWTDYWNALQRWEEQQEKNKHPST